MKPPVGLKTLNGKRFRFCAKPSLFLSLGGILLILLQGCGAPAVNLGLRAEYPKQRFRFLIDSPPAAFVKVDSLQPTFRWERFPREGDSEAHLKIDPSRIREVKYELKISAPGWSYARGDLEQPYHQVEVPLQPATKYFWTVRACFKLEEEPRCTEWGALSGWERGMFYHPHIWSYRFQTP